jgi:hypothetical protein
LKDPDPTLSALIEVVSLESQQHDQTPRARVAIGAAPHVAHAPRQLAGYPREGDHRARARAWQTSADVSLARDRSSRTSCAGAG